jgi:phosphatidylserine/phosphatidylglycerophosphate/cardiolipin synthase-like enzyme
MDGDHAIAHDKIMIIDGKTVVTGSFNFTNAAECKNAENLLIIKSDELAKIYTNNWNKHFEHSTPFGPRY